MPRIAYVNGRYVRHAVAAVHIEDRGYQFADGVYEVCEVARCFIMDMTRHLDRLDRSLSHLEIAWPMSRKALQTILRGGIWNPPETRLAGTRANTVNPDEADAARRVASLTPQQFRVLSMLCSGQSNKRIALQLDVSEATVKAHMTAVLEKMGAENRTQAVLIAQRLALHQFAPPAPEDEA